jgi:L-arabinonolactonase
MSEIQKAAHTNDLLGECPVWSAKEQSLYWVDTRGKMIHRLREADSRLSSWPVPELVGSFAIREAGGLLLALEGRLAFFDVKDGSLVEAVVLEKPGLGFRLNDGKCDRSGRFLVGSKYDATAEPRGTLFSVEPDLTWRAAEKGIAMPNSLAWSPDNRTMYFADSALRTIFSYSYDVESGAIYDRRVFAQCEWLPDGATVDCEGFVWSAGYDGWCLTRYAPDGRVDKKIGLPVQRPTSCAFGGRKLDVLYVTTARQRIAPDALAKQPLAGALLVLDVGVRGLPEPQFRG